ncbi:hypothetical protein OG905_20740 [Streptomyces sp. NBC_00322]|uniref:hypothetical protein n=1 Tax=Streptomyces sp. NBC_00322 TaxID=2975712 RepID=UPI002E2D802C|nr:hypothetical protein [Streptomyces sp. NBC_00322]
MDHTNHHLEAVVDALVRAGNRFRPRPPGKGAGPFWTTQGGPVCYMEAPIDFAVARGVPDQPAELRFHEDIDPIFCPLCWTPINGPGYRPQTVWDTGHMTLDAKVDDRSPDA